MSATHKNDGFKKYDVAIIGSGPAGCTAAIYAQRSGLSTVMFCGNNPGGQLTITTEVENYPGFQTIMGPDLMIKMMDQCRALGVEVVYAHVENINAVSTTETLVETAVNENHSVDIAKPISVLEPENISTDSTALNTRFELNASGDAYAAKVVLLATGAEAKWLGLESEAKLRQGGGVSGCATCDGSFYRGQDVAVIGGGNTAAEEALFLSKLVNKVYIIHRRDSMRCEKILMDRIRQNNKIHIIWDSIVTDMLSETGANKLNALALENVKTKAKSRLEVTGAFVAIGHTPNSRIVQHLVDLDPQGYILTKPNSTKTSVPGLFAAGDVQDKIFRQAVTSAGTGCMAALEALEFLNTGKW